MMDQKPGNDAKKDTPSSLHGTCVAGDDGGILLLGRPGCGKSDLALRLIDRGFALVADDRVLIEDGLATSPPALAGLIEARGLGLLRVPYRVSVRLALVVLLDAPVERLPAREMHPLLGLPVIRVSPFAQSAPLLIGIALDCLQGRATLAVGSLLSCK